MSINLFTQFRASPTYVCHAGYAPRCLHEESHVRGNHAALKCDCSLATRYACTQAIICRPSKTGRKSRPSLSGSMPVSRGKCTKPLFGSRKRFGLASPTFIICTSVATCGLVTLRTPTYSAPYRVVSLYACDPCRDCMPYLARILLLSKDQAHA